MYGGGWGMGFWRFCHNLETWGWGDGFTRIRAKPLGGLPPPINWKIERFPRLDDFWTQGLDFWAPRIDFWAPGVDFWAPGRCGVFVAARSVPAPPSSNVAFEATLRLA